MAEAAAPAVKFGIRRKLTLIVFLLVFGVISVLSFLDFTNGRKVLQERVFSGLSALVESKGDQIDLLLQEDLTHVALFASRYKMRECLTALAIDPKGGEACRADMIASLKEAQDAVPTITSIDVIGLNGEILLSSNRENVGKQVADKTLFLKGKSNQAFGELYAEGALVQHAVVAPVHSLISGSKDVIGVIMMTHQVSELYNVLSDYTGLGETGDVVLGRKEGNEIVFLNLLRSHPHSALKFRVPFNSGYAQPMKQALSSAESGILKGIDYRGKEVFSATRHIPLVNWGLVAKIDAEEALLPVEKLLARTLSIAFLMLFFGVIFIYFATGYISRPIKKLHEGTEIIAAGNLDYRVKINTSDEIGQLAETFNLMAEKLQRSLSVLETKVEERTKELEGVLIAQAERTKELEEQKILLIRQKAELQKLNRLKSDFISTVSHELRTPLSITKEGISLVMDGILGEVNAKQTEILGTSMENIDRLTRIINNLLDISKIESGKIELKKEMIDICEIARQTAANFTFKAQKKGLDILLDLPDKRLDVYADADRIVQVFTNLLDNAIKFTEEGRIDLSIREVDRGIECRVRDSGAGIDQEYLPHVFQKFEQFSREPGPGERGTGLGLSISKNIVELHHGMMRVESSIGAGSSFIFTIPRYGIEDVLAEKIAGAGSARGNNRVLAVYIFRFGDYALLCQEHGKERVNLLFHKMKESLGRVVRIGDFVDRNAEAEIVIFADVIRSDAASFMQRLKKLVKESIFEVTGELKIDFDMGFSLYPDDGAHATALLAKTYTRLLPEKEGRLKKCILIVDDEPLVLKTLRMSIGMLGYTCIAEAHDGEEVFEVLKTVKPDLIMLDLQLRKMSGYEVIGRLKEDISTKDVEVVILSGYAIETDKVKDLIKDKAIPMVSKPINLEQVERLLSFML